MYSVTKGLQLTIILVIDSFFSFVFKYLNLDFFFLSTQLVKQNFFKIVAD